MPPRSRASKKRRRSPRVKANPVKSWLKKLLWQGLAAALFGFVVYLGYLNYTVRHQFEGRRWALPASVYAAPLELYQGKTLSPSQLERLLGQLNYRRDRQLSSQASFYRKGSRLFVRTRAFHFPDGDQPSLRVSLRFRGAQISSVYDLEQETQLPLLRLDPVQIGSFYPGRKEDRTLIKLEQAPQILIDALLAVEDRNFYQHHGISPRAIARALWADIKAGRVVQGGSTITQQLVKNFFLSPERSILRKINEALMALILEARYSKDEILEAYANAVFLGQDGDRAIHGFGLASWHYFSRPLNELKLPEIALLVGLLKGASYYNPFRYPERAKQRRYLVIKLMAEQGMIAPGLARQAMNYPLGVEKGRQRNASRHPAFIDLVKRRLRRDYAEQDLTSEGLRIFTTLDPWIQQQLDRRIEPTLRALEKAKKQPAGSLQAAMLVVAPQGGEILALAGGRQPGFAGFNRALDALRPIGSLIKPVIYLLALSDPEKYNLLTPLQDQKIALKDKKGRSWRPQNYDHREHGWVPLHRALALSYNLATVRLGLDLGVGRVARLLRRMGVERPVRQLPSLLLGAVELSPLDVAQVYQVLAAGGFRAPLRAIREVTDAQGQPLQRYALEVEPVVPPGPAYLIARNLVEVMRSGTGRSIRRYLPENLEVAGKTGTTDDLRDSWFAGFSADLLGVVWIGRDDNKPMGLTGASGALRLWGKVMQALNPMPLGLLPPESVHYVWVDEKTGYLSAEDCPGSIAMPFLKGSEPKLRSSCLESRSDTGGDVFESWWD